MFAIGTGIPQGIEENAADMAVFAGAEDDADLRFMTRRRYGHRFFPAVDHVRRLTRQPSDISRIDFHDDSLLGAETAADTRLDDADLRFRDFQGVGDDAADMERDLRRADDGQAAKGVLIGIGPERFHSSLLILTRMIGPVDDDVRRSQDGIDVAVFVTGLGDEIALVVAADIDEGLPVVFGMDDNIVVQSFGEIEERFLDFVFDAEDAEGLVDGVFIRTGYESDGIADEADLLIQDEAVIRAQFRIGLAGNGETRLRHVFSRDDADDARHLFGSALIHLLDDGSGMGTAQGLDDETVLGPQIIRIDRLARDQGLRILLGNNVIDSFVFHYARTSFPLALK